MDKGASWLPARGWRRGTGRESWPGSSPRQESTGSGQVWSTQTRRATASYRHVNTPRRDLHGAGTALPWAATRQLPGLLPTLSSIYATLAGSSSCPAPHAEQESRPGPRRAPHPPVTRPFRGSPLLLCPSPPSPSGKGGARRRHGWPGDTRGHPRSREPSLRPRTFLGQSTPRSLSRSSTGLLPSFRPTQELSHCSSSLFL